MVASSSSLRRKLHGLVPESFETYQIVNPGDIVLRTTDLQNDHTSLRVGMVRDRGIITSAYLALRVNTGVSPDFGFQFLNVWDMSKAIYGYGSGLRQGLDFSHFKRMPVALPPPAEQAAIVRFLDWANGRLERAIRAKRKVIALLNEQKQAIIHRAVTRGLDPSVPPQTLRHPLARRHSAALAGMAAEVCSPEYRRLPPCDAEVFRRRHASGDPNCRYCRWGCSCRPSEEGLFTRLRALDDATTNLKKEIFSIQERANVSESRRAYRRPPNCAYHSA
jgi:hypothetical protein